MGLVLGHLRMPPDVFWRLTLPELDAIIRGSFPAAEAPSGVNRSTLSALMTRFPDRPREVP
ncbi:MAG: phage tail assembly chaperone [Hyphomicrobiales bacterium]|nr:MAG: phage tail assembly chaperone [Hyphomicrobiales bacterium]